MELIKFFLKDEVPAVGLSKFRDKKDYSAGRNFERNYTFRKQYFKPNYNNNFFLM